MNARSPALSVANPQPEPATVVAPQSEVKAEVKIFSASIDFTTAERMEFFDICKGFVHIQSLHTTTGLFINECQEALIEDMKTHLSEMVSRELDWRHNNPQYSDCDRRNADSHLRGMLLGQSVILQVRGSALVIGTWQRILLAEFDGPRSRTVSVQALGI